MADTFTGPASQNIDNAAAQALSAVAQSGSAGKAAFDQATQANAAAKTSALKDAMAYAALRGAPQGNVTAGQGMVSAPFDDRAATLAGIGANYAAHNQAMGAANTGFFSGVKAGLPAVKGQLDQKVAGLQEAAAAKQAALNAQIQSRANANDMAALRLQLAQEKFNASQNPPATTVGKFITGLGGADLAGDQLKALVDQAPTGADQISQVGGGHPAAGVNEVTDPMRDSLPDIVAGSPISPALARQLMTNSEQKDNSQQLATNAAQQRAGNTVDPKSVNAGISSATNYFGTTKSPSFAEWWGKFVGANPNVDPATLTAIRDNTRPMFP